MKPLVSVLVPVHNQERYLGRCLRSLLAQDMTREKYEIVVIDDGSTDRSAYALELFADEITLVSLPTNRGLPAALNVGLQTAQADLVVRVDSDDYVNSRFLSVLHLFLESNPSLDAVACDYILVDNDEVVLGRGNADEESSASTTRPSSPMRTSTSGTGSSSSITSPASRYLFTATADTTET